LQPRPAPLLRVQRLVGSGEQFLDRTGARRVEPDHANTEGQRVATARLPVVLAQRFGYTLRDRRCTVIVSVDRQHGELVPAQARNDVRLPKASRENLRGLDQRAITLRVTEGIVDLFEVVHVDDDEPTPSLGTTSELQVLCGERDKAAAVVQTRQLIAKGQP